MIDWLLPHLSTGHASHTDSAAIKHLLRAQQPLPALPFMGESHKKLGGKGFYAEDLEKAMITIWIFGSKILKTVAVSFSKNNGLTSIPTFTGDLSLPEQTVGKPPAERRLTVSTLVVVPVQFIVVGPNKPLASAVASSLHHHCSDSRLSSSQGPHICNSKQYSIMH